MRPNNDNNVYILGAGFSAEAGIPLISSFLTRMRDAVDWLEKNRRDREREAIERVLDFRHQSAAAGYRINIDLDNIEQPPQSTLQGKRAAPPPVGSASTARTGGKLVRLGAAPLNELHQREALTPRI
jgi:hypothetical protein